MAKGDFSGIAKKPRIQKTVDDFIEAAAVDGKGLLNPKSKRDYKSIRLGFNEYEYKLLEEAASAANLSLVAYIRTSWMNRAKEK